MRPKAVPPRAGPAGAGPAGAGPGGAGPGGADPAARHLAALVPALEALAAESERLHRWAALLAARLSVGARLLAAGNGGSAAEAQHLTAELVGRFRADRRPFAALALHAETSSLTAIGNDYGYREVFARQVQAHARSGDVLVLLSTSGRSANLLAAAAAARSAGALSWALTGAAPNPLALACDDALCLPGAAATVQEAHLVGVHLLCGLFEEACGRPDQTAADGELAAGLW